jgi:hypothetical protein
VTVGIDRFVLTNARQPPRNAPVPSTQQERSTNNAEASLPAYLASYDHAVSPLRPGTAIGDAVWRPDHVGPQPARRMRWRQRSDGSVVVDVPAPGTSVVVTDVAGSRIDVEIERADGAGPVGVALLYDSAERHY